MPTHCVAPPSVGALLLPVLLLEPDPLLVVLPLVPDVVLVVPDELVPPRDDEELPLFELHAEAITIAMAIARKDRYGRMLGA